MPARLLLLSTLLLSVHLGGCAATGPLGDEDDAAGESEVIEKSAGHPFGRVAEVHAYEEERWQLPLDTPADVATAIIAFRPTFVTGLVKIESPDFFETTALEVHHQQTNLDRMRDDFEVITGKVSDAGLDTRFDVWLTGRRYGRFEDTGEDQTGCEHDQAHGRNRCSLEHVLALVKHHFAPRAIFFDFFRCPPNPGSSASCDTHDDVMEKAIAWCHRRDILVGGNYFGPPKAGGATLEADFLAVSDSQDPERGDFGPGAGAVESKLKEQIRDLRDLAPGAEVLLHINENPQNSFHGIGAWRDAPGGEANYAFPTPSCMFGNPEDRGGRFWWGANERAAYLEQRTKDQAAWGHRFVYGLIAPSCVPTGPVAGVEGDASNWASACGCTAKPGPGDLPAACHGHAAAPGECLQHQVWYEASRDRFGARTMLDHMTSLAGR